MTIAAQTFWEANQATIAAVAAVLGSIALAVIVDRLLLARAEHAAQRAGTQVFSREAKTRLRWLRRFTYLGIILIGCAIALEQVTSLERITTGILASTAIIGLIIGIAGQTVLANFFAGLLLTITQSVRIGDRVTVGEGDTRARGIVVDIALTYTQLDTGNGQSTVVPNSSLVNQRVVNHSTGDSSQPVKVEMSLPVDVDLAEVRRVLTTNGVEAVELRELGPDAALVTASAPMEGTRLRVDEESSLLERCQNALRTAGLLSAE